MCCTVKKAAAPLRHHVTTTTASREHHHVINDRYWHAGHASGSSATRLLLEIPRCIITHNYVQLRSTAFHGRCHHHPSLPSSVVSSSRTLPPLPDKVSRLSVVVIVIPWTRRGIHSGPNCMEDQLWFSAPAAPNANIESSALWGTSRIKTAYE